MRRQKWKWIAIGCILLLIVTNLWRSVELRDAIIVVHDQQRTTSTRPKSELRNYDEQQHTVADTQSDDLVVYPSLKDNSELGHAYYEQLEHQGESSQRDHHRDDDHNIIADGFDMQIETTHSPPRLDHELLLNKKKELQKHANKKSIRVQSAQSTIMDYRDANLHDIRQPIKTTSNRKNPLLPREQQVAIHVSKQLPHHNFQDARMNRYASQPRRNMRQIDQPLQTKLKDSEVKLIRRFPSALIIGVKKGGTRALISMLSKHPKIAIAQHEVQYFSYNYHRGRQWYIQQMPFTTRDAISMEKSPNYFSIDEVPERVYYQSKKVKLILIVRNPLDRAVSDYVQYVSDDWAETNHGKQQVPPKFESMVLKNWRVITADRNHFIQRSLYDKDYMRWRKYFKKSQILVVNGDELVSNPVSILKKVENFLNVPTFFKDDMFVFDEEKGFYCWNSQWANQTTAMPHCLGSTKGRPHPVIAENVQKTLNAFFHPHTKRFCIDASVDFSWCNYDNS